MRFITNHYYCMWMETSHCATVKYKSINNDKSIKCTFIPTVTITSLAVSLKALLQNLYFKCHKGQQAPCNLSRPLLSVSPAWLCGQVKSARDHHRPIVGRKHRLKTHICTFLFPETGTGVKILLQCSQKQNVQKGLQRSWSRYMSQTRNFKYGLSMGWCIVNK